MKKKKPFLIALALIAASLTGCTIASAPESNANKPSDDSSQGIHDEVYVNSIEVIKNPTQMDYVPGEESFNPDGIVLKATWSDGYVEEVGSQKIYYEPMGILSDEDSTITIYYGDASTTLNILTDSSFELYILTPPLKTDYISGEIFDPKGIVLGYKNPLTGKTKEIKGFNALDVSYSTNTLSTKDTFVTITYKNKQVNVPINVRNKAIQIELEDQSRVSYFGGAMPKSTVLFDAVNITLPVIRTSHYIVLIKKHGTNGMQAPQLLVRPWSNTPPEMTLSLLLTTRIEGSLSMLMSKKQLRIACSLEAQAMI